jgi:phage virion morphogenesis protein
MIIEINSSEVTAALNLMRNRAENLQPVLHDIGETIRSTIDLGFRDGKSPDGINWAALSPVTIEKKGSTTPLINHGTLRNSITYSVGNDFVDIGTNDKRATMLNFGGTKAQFPHLWGDIPARPFMPQSQLPADWEAQIIEQIRVHLS